MDTDNTTQVVYLKRGATFRQLVSATDANGDPVDLTGSTLRCAISDVPGSDTSLAECTVTEEDLAAGQFWIELDYDDTLGLPEGTLYFDIRSVDLGGIVWYSETAIVYVLPHVTPPTAPA